jgi:cytochrome c oxidase subunit 2
MQRVAGIYFFSDSSTRKLKRKIMTALFVILTLILIGVIVVQIGRVTELAAKIRGEEEMQLSTNRRNAAFLLVFMILFLAACIASGLLYKNYFLGFGPQVPASAHGKALDNMFKVTLFFTGLVFFITQVLLFYFAWRYRGKKGGKAVFLPKDNRLEIVWTVVPAVVMAFLVISGLDAWNEVMADVNPDEEFMEIEATGYQFAWQLRYPGPDGKLGEKDFRLITGTNVLGQNWKDKKNLDDILPQELVLPVGKKVRVRIIARDVLHDFYLPQFRVKMDAVPGMPTYFVFTPTKTTEEFRQELRNYPEFQKPEDPTDPNSPMLWENFNYELACAELCGQGHYSMHRTVRIVSEEEYQSWLDSQSSFYFSSIRGTAEDPYKDEWFDFEIRQRRTEFNEKLENLIANDTANTFVFDHVNFETDSATLSPTSSYELDFLVEALNRYPNMRIELASYTDEQGEEAANLALSQQRAEAVFDYLTEKGIDESRLTAVGYGETQPVDSNQTEEEREQNRRTEFKILSM